MDTLELRAPGKLNLWLRVVGRRPDGYHELASLMVPIGLCDLVRLEPGQTGITCRCPGRPELDGERNLAARAARRWMELSGRNQALHITIRKRVPVEAGLGGGSSDAAAVLRGLQRLAGPGLSPSRLDELALELGADVPFFLRGGACLAAGIGERLTPVRVPPFWVILARAPFGLSTRRVFEHLKIPLTSAQDGDNRKSPLEGFARLAGSLVNDLQPTALAMQASIGGVLEDLLRAGAAGASMSGSGPTVFGLFRTRREARVGLRRLERRSGWGYTVVPRFKQQ
jgi:4-diphosphocytidyl-2-C-methyl-D-erythritol kinase